MISDKYSGGKGNITSIKTGPFEGKLALTRLGLGAVGKNAAHSLANNYRSSVETEEPNRTFYPRHVKMSFGGTLFHPSPENIGDGMRSDFGAGP